MSLMYDALRAGSGELAAAHSSSSQNLPSRNQRVPAFVVIPSKLLIYGSLGLLLLSALTAAFFIRGLDDKKASLTAQSKPAPAIVEAVEIKANGAQSTWDKAQKKLQIEVGKSKDLPITPVLQLTGSLQAQPVAASQAADAETLPIRVEPGRSVTVASPAMSKQTTAAALPRANTIPAASPVKSQAADAKALVALTVTGVATAAAPAPALLKPVNGEPITQVTSSVPAVPLVPAVQAVQAAAIAPVALKAAGPAEVKLLAPRSASQVPAAMQPIDEAISLAERFDLMNRDLIKADKADAGIHLKAIQSALPASSIARLRAEGWYEYQTGNLEAARKTYRKLLDRVPADEQAKSVLQALSAAGNTAVGLK